MNKQSKTPNIIKYKRGQVWMRRSSSVSSGSVQSNNRPCLIISNDRGNISQDTVMIVKITSVGSKRSIGINVPFINDQGATNVILCNQIETIDTKELSYYMFTLTNNIMTEVETAILQAQDIAYERDIPTAISEIYRVLSRLEVIKADNGKTVKEDQEAILKTAEKLKECYLDLGKYYEQSSEEIKKRVDPYTEYLVHKELNISPVDSSNIEEEINEFKFPIAEKPKRKNRKWNKESMEEFIKDKYELSLKDMSEKWGFEDTKKCAQMFYNIRNRYEKLYGKIDFVNK